MFFFSNVLLHCTVGIKGSVNELLIRFKVIWNNKRLVTVGSGYNLITSEIFLLMYLLWKMNVTLFGAGTYKIN